MTSSQLFSRLLFLSALSLGGCMMSTEPGEDGAGSDAAALAAVAAGECVPDCSGRSCGLDPVCGVSCGTCGTGQECNQEIGQCEVACVPDCGGRTCGVDPVCGKSCGECANGASCDVTAGVCKLPPPGHACPYSSSPPRRHRGRR
jgi:hypothetical protein